MNNVTGRCVYMTWYEQSFGADYLTVYRHRNSEQAKREVGQLLDWLRLPSQAKVLDLCCGMGRHSMSLADFGFDVTGMDLSEILLARAREIDTSFLVRWIQGDMRNIPLPEACYDAVVNLFTSFGYFEKEQDNKQVLLEIERLLKPDGRWIIDYLNPEVVIASLVPKSERTEKGVTIVENRFVEEGMVKKKIEIMEENQPPRIYIEQVQLFNLSDFERMLHSTSLVVDKIVGDYTGAKYDAFSSPRMILIGHKTE